MRKNIKATKRQDKDYTMTLELITEINNNSNKFAARQLSRTEDILCWSMAANLLDNVQEHLLDNVTEQKYVM